jgi:hypothetical protein
MDVRSGGSIWQIFAKFFQPQLLSGVQPHQATQPQTEQAIKPAVKVNHFSFDPNRPPPEGPFRRGMLVDIVV